MVMRRMPDARRLPIPCLWTRRVKQVGCFHRALTAIPGQRSGRESVAPWSGACFVPVRTTITGTEAWCSTRLIH